MENTEISKNLNIRVKKCPKCVPKALYTLGKLKKKILAQFLDLVQNAYIYHESYHLFFQVLAGSIPTKQLL